MVMWDICSQLAPLTNVTKFLTFREVMEMDQEEGS